MEARTTLCINHEDVADGIQKWKHAVLGFTLGSANPYSVVRSLLKQSGRKWVIVLKSGVYIFNFAFEYAKCKVLDRSSWPFFQQKAFFEAMEARH